MTGDPGEMVAIGTAGDPMEGAMVREFLTSNGIDCIIHGENHRSMLQMLGAFIELRILVPRSQAEEAGALLADFRRQSLEPGPAEEVNEAGEVEEEEAEEEESIAWRDDADLVRRARGGRLLSLVLPGFGIAHFAIGAKVRGLILFLVAWPTALWLSSGSGPVAMALVPISALLDFFAAPAALSEVIRRRARAQVPMARARQRPPT